MIDQTQTDNQKEKDENLGPKVEMGHIPESTLRELVEPDMTQQPLCIVNPKTTILFELKPDLNHLLLAFKGSVGENPHKHLKDFHVVCDRMRLHDVMEEQRAKSIFIFVEGWSQGLTILSVSGINKDLNELKKFF